MEYGPLCFTNYLYDTEYSRTQIHCTSFTTSWKGLHVLCRYKRASL